MSYERELSILDVLTDTISQDTRDLALNIDRRLVRETPRDTGTAKAGWLVSINQPNNNYFEWTGGPGAAESDAIRKGMSVIANFRAGDLLYIQNNQPHIDRLNEGHSEQAPSKYVDAILVQEVAKSNR